MLTSLLAVVLFSRVTSTPSSLAVYVTKTKRLARHFLQPKIISTMVITTTSSKPSDVVSGMRRVVVSMATSEPFPGAIIVVSMVVIPGSGMKISQWSPVNPDLHVTLVVMAIAAYLNIPEYVSLLLVLPTEVVTLIANLSISSSPLLA